MSINNLQKDDLVNYFLKQISEIKFKKLGLAVSGGGDSLALLMLSNEWAKIKKKKLFISTVDHKLRRESVEEVRFVKKLTDSLSHNHTSLIVKDKYEGNLQSAAREKRYSLLSNWAKENNIDVILLGHNLDDQVETIFLRLLRGSGIDGLTGIFRKKIINDVLFYRPLLDISREDLRSYLRVLGLSWIEDKSNDNIKFDRIKIRKIIDYFSENSKFEKKRISNIAYHMQRAQKSLNETLLEKSSKIVKVNLSGDVQIDLCEFKKISYELQLRMVSSLLLWISGKVYKPRLIYLENFTKALCSSYFKSKTLMGVIASRSNKNIIMRRELNFIKDIAVKDKKVFIWEHRWHLQVTISKFENLYIRPIRNIKKYDILYENDFLSVQSINLLPGLFKNEELLCIPSLNYGKGLRVIKPPSFDSFLKFLT